MIAKPLTADLAQTWDQLLENSDDGWVTSLADWQTSICNLGPDSPEDKSFLVFHEGVAVAGFPLQHNRWQRALFSTAVGYGGPFVSKAVDSSFRKKILAYAFEQVREIGKRCGCQTIEVSICPVTQSSLANKHAVNPLIYYGFEDTSTHARILDLSMSEDELWGGLSAATRRNIKKARAAGYTVEKVTWEEHLATYQRIHESTYCRTGATPFTDVFHKAIQRLAERGFSNLYAGFSPEGKVVAFHNTAVFGTSSRYWQGCCESDQLTSNINHLLFWSAIVAAKKNGGKQYLVGEIFHNCEDQKLADIATFKSRFGGDMRRIFEGKLYLERPSPAEPSGRELLNQLVSIPAKLFRKGFRDISGSAGVDRGLKNA